jgi:MoxR-like ATPase
VTNQALATKNQTSMLRDALLNDLVERDVPVRLALLAALAGEHLLLLGPPGTAKSEIARRLRHAFVDAAFFERLLTRFTVPEELFGPLSIKGLEEDRYERLTRGYLPQTSVAFLDEIFKANSAILNSLLTLLNEREFDNGTVREKTPIVCVIGASNELPQEDGMDALYDRFLLRCHVGPVSPAGFARLVRLETRPCEVPQNLKLSSADLARIREAAAHVTIPDDVLKLLEALRQTLIDEKIEVSDRRWRKIVGLLKTAAFTDGRAEVSLWDCWLLPHCTWSKPEQRIIVEKWYADHAGAAQADDPAHFVKLTQTFEARLKTDSNKQDIEHNEKGEPLFVSDEGRVFTKQKVEQQRKNAAGKLLFHIPHGYGHGAVTKEELQRYGVDPDTYAKKPDSKVVDTVECRPKLVPKRYDRSFIDRRTAEAQEHRDSLTRHIAGLDARLASLTRDIDGHLWIEPGFSKVARPQLEESLRIAKALEARWNAIVDGFTTLPVAES